MTKAEKRAGEVWVKSLFPKLSNGGFEVVGPANPRYNCISLAANDPKRRWWWPDRYWPPSVPRALSLDAFVKAFQSLGYTVCADGSLEEGMEKVAIYVDFMSLQPKHAARQLPSGRWLSKLGKGYEIEHDAADGVEVTSAQLVYGNIAQFIVRPVTK